MLANFEPGPGATVMKVASANFFFDGAHTLFYLANTTIERSKTRGRGFEWFAINFPAQDVDAMR